MTDIGNVRSIFHQKKITEEEAKSDAVEISLDEWTAPHVITVGSARIYIISTQSDLDTISNPQKGHFAYTKDDKKLFIYNGTQWVEWFSNFQLLSERNQANGYIGLDENYVDLTQWTYYDGGGKYKLIHEKHRVKVIYQQDSSTRPKGHLVYELEEGTDNWEIKGAFYSRGRDDYNNGREIMIAIGQSEENGNPVDVSNFFGWIVFSSDYAGGGLSRGFLCWLQNGAFHASATAYSKSGRFVWFILKREGTKLSLELYNDSDYTNLILEKRMNISSDKYKYLIIGWRTQSNNPCRGVAEFRDLQIKINGEWLDNNPKISSGFFPDFTDRECRPCREVS